MRLFASCMRSDGRLECGEYECGAPAVYFWIHGKNFYGWCAGHVMRVFRPSPLHVWTSEGDAVALYLVREVLES